jgi:ligand-binding SRPBCC domain-containing protein
VIYTIHREQWVPRPIDEVFEFFSDAHNLEAITPPKLNFHVLTPAPIDLKTGALIDYKLRINGIPIRWITRIDEWNPPYGFVDTQLKGPYKLWRHSHEFISENNGTRMIDHVRYKLPFGLLGTLVHALWVKHNVESIFAYREKIIGERFR